MLNKVLIVEDQETANISVQKTVEEMEIHDVHYSYYCDDALVKLRNAKLNLEPYDLLITDLYFEKDYNAQQIIDGIALIENIRKEQPELKILVFSAESKPAIIEKLYDKLLIDGYVRKARNDAKDLRLALQTIIQHKRYQPRHLQQLLKQKQLRDFTEFDIAIITLLAEGVRLKDIPAHLASKQIQPYGLSTVEKRLNYIKEISACSTNEQLIAFCKDMGII